MLPSKIRSPSACWRLPECKLPTNRHFHIIKRLWFNQTSHQTEKFFCSEVSLQQFSIGNRNIEREERTRVTTPSSTQNSSGWSSLQMCKMQNTNCGSSKQFHGNLSLLYKLREKYLELLVTYQSEKQYLLMLIRGCEKHLFGFRLCIGFCVTVKISWGSSLPNTWPRFLKTSLPNPS